MLLWMAVLVLSQREVEELLDMKGCIAAMEAALTALARGELHLPLRSIVRPPARNDLLGLMPSHRGGDQPVYALKTVCVVPDNPSRGLDPHQGTVTLYDGETGEVRAVMNASPITAIRTAACTAVATRLLARDDARVAAVIGAGHQAKAHLEALRTLRDFDEIRIAGRTEEHAAALAATSPNARSVSTAEEAVRGAGVVVTVTSSPEPVLRREWLDAGTHVNAVGSCFPHTRELDSATVADAAFFVDRRESAESEAGDYLIPLREGVIGRDHIRAEIGDVLVGASPGRGSHEEITVFESLGIAIEDLFAAEYVVGRARESGRGTELEF
jgi:ornithine cyclodeaminase/alanine dehydrogenase-like protein (mu-crystallin family)